ncbi:unnamed protein product, partial [Rotaria sp. Silwood1]
MSIMSNKEYNEQMRILSKKTNEIIDEELWNNFNINFQSEALKFPDNKIYGTINIEPESARQLIEKFMLFINGHNRGEFDRSYQSISITGFDISKEEENLIRIEIQAIPYDKQWTTTKKSKPCFFVFTGQILTLSSIIRFHYVKETSTFNVIVKWYHIGDHYAQKYVILLDDKEIQY